MAQGGNRFSALLLEGLDHYRKGRMLEAVRAWEEAYLLEPTNLRAREFLRSALERIHAHMGPGGAPANDTAQPGAAPAHPWLPARPLAVPAEVDPNAQTLMREPPPAPAGQGSPPQKPAAAAPAPVQAPRPMAQPPPPPPDALITSPWDEGPSLAIPQPEEQS